MGLVTLRDALATHSIHNPAYIDSFAGSRPRLECVFWIFFRHQLPLLVSQCQNQRMPFSQFYSFLDFLQHNRWLGKMLLLMEISHVPQVSGQLPCNYIRIKVRLRADQIFTKGQNTHMAHDVQAIDIFEPFYLDLPSSIVYNAFDCANADEKAILANTHDVVQTATITPTPLDLDSYKVYCSPAYAYFKQNRPSEICHVVLPSRFVFFSADIMVPFYWLYSNDDNVELIVAEDQWLAVNKYSDHVRGILRDTTVKAGQTELQGCHQKGQAGPWSPRPRMPDTRGRGKRRSGTEHRFK